MKSDPNPQSSRSLGIRLGARRRPPTQHEPLRREHEILGDHRADATRATQLS
jgi:hypothetical protein